MSQPPPHEQNTSGFALPTPAPSLSGHPADAYEDSEEEAEEEGEELEADYSSPDALPAGRLLDSIDADMRHDHAMDDHATDGHHSNAVSSSLLAAAAQASFAALPPLPTVATQPLLSGSHQAEPALSSSASSSHSPRWLHSANSSSSRPSGSQRSSSHANAQRISKACNACRHRKRKCDGVMPQCTTCARTGGLCQYPLQTKRRGPQAGMVHRLRLQVSALELELHKERSRNSSAAAAAVAAGNIAEHANVGPLLARDVDERKAQLYIAVYFNLLNSTLFPFLKQSNFDADYARYAANPVAAPAVWHLTVASVLAQGAAVSGDLSFSEDAALVARAAAAPLLDQPSAAVIRGLLLLSYHCLSCNQLSRVSCFLAVATRMCAIVDVSAEVPLLCRWLEDMLCAVRTWWRGLQTMPEGSYQKEQRERYPADWARYERLSAYLKVHQQLPSQASLTAASPVTSTSPTRRSAASAYSLTGPPDPSDLNDSNIRWELFHSLCGMSEARGEYNQDTHLSFYRHLCVLSKAEHSPLTMGAVATTIAFLKSQALFFVNEIGTAVEYARVCTRNMLTHDVSNCAFTSLVGHFLCQVHLKTGDYAHLAIALSMMRTCAARWQFAVAPLRNIEQVIQQRIAPLVAAANGSEEALPSDFEPIHALPPADRSKAEAYYQSSVIPSEEVREKNRKRKLEREEAEVLAASQQPPSPTILSALQAHYTFPSVAQTIAAFHPAFKQALRVTASTEQEEKGTPSPPSATGRRGALRGAGGELRADHPHPHLSTLKDSTFTLKREQIEQAAMPEALTAPPAEHSKPPAQPHTAARSSATAVAAMDVVPIVAPPLPHPAKATAAPTKQRSHTARAMPPVAETHAWQANLFTPHVTAVSSNSYSTAFTSSPTVSYQPPLSASSLDRHAFPYFPLTGGAYSSPYTFGRHLSLDSATAAPSVPSFQYGSDTQHASDAGAAAYYQQQRSYADMQQMADDGGAPPRHPTLQPSLHNAPHLQMSHSTPLSGAAGMYLPPFDSQQSPYAQPASLYNPMVQPPLPHALSAPLPPFLYNQHPAFAAPQSEQQRVAEVNAVHGQFSNQFAESKRRHRSSTGGIGGSNNRGAK